MLEAAERKAVYLKIAVPWFEIFKDQESCDISLFSRVYRTHIL